ncbi:MAG: DNA repair protein RecO [Acholeplasma sp.]|nr:MAG: DNA repair protein RecO [Acholeplasma sp.]
MEGIIYKIQPYQEHARLCFVYTMVGKKTLLAQGSQKVNSPYRILAQYLTKIDFKDQAKPFITLQEGKILNDYQTIKADYHQTKAAGIILELIDHVIMDNMDHGQLYHEVNLALMDTHLELSSLSFAIKLFEPLGYHIHLTGDGRKIKGVSIERGSIIYEGEAIPIDLDVKGAVDLLRLSLIPYQELMNQPWNDLTKIKEFILKYYQFHLQLTLKNLQ